MIFPPQKIKTARLILRMPLKEDAVTIFEQYAQDSEVTKYLTWEPHRSITDTNKFLARCVKAWQTGSAFPWVIIKKSDNQLIQLLEIVRIDHAGAHIGFVLARDSWGNGYMTESLISLIKWCLTQKQIYRVWSICDVENTSSARVLERAGMQKEGILRRWIALPRFGTQPRDCYVYSIIK